MTTPPDPRQRLLSAIAAAYAGAGGRVEGETLILPDGDISLCGLLRYLEQLPASREFTRLPPLFGPGQGLPMASMQTANWGQACTGVRLEAKTKGHPLYFMHQAKTKGHPLYFMHQGKRWSG